MATSTDLEYGATGDRELTALEALLSDALQFGRDHMTWWIVQSGTEHSRVVRRGGRIAAGLSMAPMGQWFGGQRVPVAVVNGVGVAPEHRGSGVGKALMSGLLRELHGAGRPLSILYASSLAFYRSVGYERAGTRLGYELPLSAIDARERTLEVVPLGPDDPEPIYQVYEQLARRTPGKLDRAVFIWPNILAAPWASPRAFLATRDGTPEGYIVVSQGTREEPLRIRDIGMLSRAAGLRLMAFLSGYRSILKSVAWNGTPNDPLLQLLPEQHYTITMAHDWLLRIVDVAGAIGARGYPHGLSAELHLEIEDELLAANSGRWLVTVADGRAEARPGGAGRIRLHIRALATLYSGHLTPEELRLSGLIDGPDEDLALLELVFAGARPRLSDSF